MFDFKEIEKLSREFNDARREFNDERKQFNQRRNKVMNETEIFVIPNRAVNPRPTLIDGDLTLTDKRKEGSLSPVGVAYLAERYNKPERHGDYNGIKSPSVTDMWKAMRETGKNPVGIVHTRKMLEAAISDGVFLRVKDAKRINCMLIEGWHVPKEKVPQLIPLSYPFRKEIWDAVNFNREFTVSRASTTFVGLWS